MYKRFLALILCLAMLAGVTGQALAAEETAAPAAPQTEETAAPEAPQTGAAEEVPAAPQTEAAAVPGTPQVYVDGVLVENAHAAVLNQVTYVSFTGLVLALRPEAALSWENGQSVARAEGLELAARPGAIYLYANGRYLYVPDAIQAGENETLVPVRVLAQALGADVAWDGAVQVTSEGTPLTPGQEFYDEDAVFLLSHVIYNESGNQPLAGKIAVGNVLLNRVAHPSFPNTLRDVIYQPNQFYPEKTGCMAKTPNEGSILAAKLCLEGAVVVPNAYWFNGVGRSCWASRNKTCVAVIGGHAFYG